MEGSVLEVGLKLTGCSSKQEEGAFDRLRRRINKIPYYGVDMEMGAVCEGKREEKVRRGLVGRGLESINTTLFIH